ncbi:aminoglycoside phosphotransferase family protein [Deinococcus sp.]|uniref:aminoglycoside phosphotransferase family protein n=1 Tax=Deinococcus sp. TaxID=47478 RepID=UPI003B5BB8DF
MTAPSITAALVDQLIAGQFPQWASLPVTPVEPGGHDNRTFRLGDTMSVRLPSGGGYVPQVEKEQRWLPHLASRLPLPIPVPLAQGLPSADYPWPWSVYRWLEGENAESAHIADLPQLATDLGAFLSVLHRLEDAGGPAPGPDNFFRGGPLAVYDAEAQQAIEQLRSEVDSAAAKQVWNAALSATRTVPPVWFHGDVSAANLLTRRGRLSAVIDFGCAGVGDPACDLTIAWTMFAGESREVFRTALPADADTWARARGWALWKALISLAEYRHTDALKAQAARRVVAEVLNDHPSLT